jgi:hypothetical protein
LALSDSYGRLRNPWMVSVDVYGDRRLDSSIFATAHKPLPR